MLNIPLHHGYWCECTILSPSTGEHPAVLASIASDSPGQATHWIHNTVRTIASALDAGANRDAGEWVLGGYLDMERTLKQDEAATFSLTQKDTRIGWYVRPVIFLPLADRESKQLPPCAEQFTSRPAPYETISSPSPTR
ncbi:hypothetical protein AB0I49_03415 [Streptomyces sp. NPDC050617]|uniref:hypothetical protein n=1 Tax=Streptomyces sp. NPDC050617 TaxID=3154628 RepID=UPI003449C095